MSKLPQAEDADWFLVIDPEDRSVVFGYPAEMGRSFGHDHIKDAMEDRAEFAKRWKVVPAFAAPQPQPAELPHIKQFWVTAVDAGEALAKSGGDGMAFCNAVDRLTEAILHSDSSLPHRHGQA